MADLIGQRLGQYEIVALLGEGGMATVYRARQVSIGRDVAVKVIESKLARNPEFVRRFEREARTVAQLSQSHILKVFDYGQQGDLIYLVMELLAGGSLEALIRQGALPVDRASRLLDQVSSALNYAHRRGVIHRDLKPANVLLDEDGDAHLTDFGIAKMLSSTTALTQSGMAMGTPAYMSPEQWLGQPVDSRADIYALGIMLFEMLSGALPFNADTPFGMMHKHVYDPPPPIRGLRPDLPPGVDGVLQEALSKEREIRFQTTEEMAQAFKSALAGKSAPVRRSAVQPDLPNATSRSALSRFRTRHWGRTDPLSLGTAVTALIVLALVIFGLSNRGSSPDAAAQAPTNTPQGVLRQPTLIPSATVAPTDTLQPSYTPSIKHTPDFRATAVVAVRETATANARASFTSAPSPTLDINALALATIHAEATLTATYPLATPTIDLPATLSAARTAILALTHAAEETTTAIAVASFTQTPSLTASNTATQTPPPPPTWTPTATRTSTPTFIPSATNLPAASSTVATTSALTAIAVAMVPQAAIITVANADQVTEWGVAQNGGRLIDAIVFSPDGKLLASGGDDQHILLSDVQTGQLLKTLTGHDAQVLGVAFSPDGTLLASASLDSTVRLWKIPDGKQRIVLQGHKAGVRSVAFSPNGKLLASVGEDRMVRLWDVQTGAQQAVLQGHTDTVNAVAFSPDGKLLASAGGDRVVRLWDVKTGVQQAVLQGHTNIVNALAFSPDGKLLASAGGDRVVRLWDVKTGVQQAIFQGHTDSVNSVIFNADGTLLASGAADMTVRLWDVQKPSQKTLLQGHTGTVSSVAFNTDSTLLASGSHDKTLRLWGWKDTRDALDRCAISAEGDKKVAIRVGPGKNRGVLSYMVANQVYPVMGQAKASDGQPWWQLKTADGSQAWVAQAEAKVSGNCGQMALVATPRVQLPPKPTSTSTPLPTLPPPPPPPPPSGGGNQPPPATSVPPTAVCAQLGQDCYAMSCCSGLNCVYWGSGLKCQ